MSRDVKFRVWNKVDETMYTDAINNCKDTFDMVLKHPQIYEVMQYTGIKDMNGAEICEGDIVSAFDGKIKAKIIWGFCGFEFQWITKHTAKIRMKETEPIFKNISIIFEVVGNIYEKPELLEEGVKTK